ncbi:hypothetical protein VTN00DRAFT_5630 [Thermoascus crustaceus]|uniref:uncharacterized protein n=1 Tax=Thermoascus crustaceus TaxID=5088 RepID=UPI003743C295
MDSYAARSQVTTAASKFTTCKRDSPFLACVPWGCPQRCHPFIPDGHDTVRKPGQELADAVDRAPFLLSHIRLRKAGLLGVGRLLRGSTPNRDRRLCLRDWLSNAGLPPSLVSQHPLPATLRSSLHRHHAALSLRINCAKREQRKKNRLSRRSRPLLESVRLQCPLIPLCHRPKVPSLRGIPSPYARYYSNSMTT